MAWRGDKVSPAHALKGLATLWVSYWLLAIFYYGLKCDDLLLHAQIANREKVTFFLPQRKTRSQRSQRFKRYRTTNGH